jgi:uncharacterized GH25 family protein
MSGAKMIRRLFALCLLGLGSAAAAHDFWLQPVRWQAVPGEDVGITLQVGHGSTRQRSPIPASRVLRFESVGPDGDRVDRRAALHIGAPQEDAAIAFDRAGTYSVVFETDNRAESHLPAQKFNAYLAEEGLTPAQVQRKHTGRMQADGAENYSRHARTIVQIGPVDVLQQAQITRPSGMTLEIVPEISPVALTKGQALPVRIYYRGRPLAGALVKLNDLDQDAVPIAEQRSDAQGRATFTFPHSGSWQLNVVWTRPQPRTSLADFDTSFSSLSFAIAK